MSQKQHPQKQMKRFSKTFKTSRPYAGLKSSSLTGPSPSAIKYSGPLKPPSVGKDRVVARLTTIGALNTTSVAGVFLSSLVFPASGVTATTDWTDYVALYQEFRVLGMSITFVPKFSKAWNESTAVVAATILSPQIFAPYHGDASALTTLDAAINHARHQMAPIDKNLSAEVRMDESDEAQWFSTTSGTTGTEGIKTFFSGSLTAAAAVINWGYYIISFTAQFRSRVVSATQLSLRLSSSPSIPLVPYPTVCISASTETKQQAAYEHKQKSESSQKESKLTGTTTNSVQNKQQAFTQYGQEYVLVLKNDQPSSSSSTPSNGSSVLRYVGPSGDPLSKST